jgi:hypothetical protein
MLEILQENPWLIPILLGALIPILGIVFGSTTKAWTQVRRAEIDAALKHEMLQRGMSAEEIRTVMEATSFGKPSKGRCGMRAASAGAEGEHAKQQTC